MANRTLKRIEEKEENVNKKLSDIKEILQEIKSLIEEKSEEKSTEESEEAADIYNFEEMTMNELYSLAREKEIEGRSGMNKEELAKALEEVV